MFGWLKSKSRKAIESLSAMAEQGKAMGKSGRGHKLDYLEKAKKHLTQARDLRFYSDEVEEPLAQAMLNSYHPTR